MMKKEKILNKMSEINERMKQAESFFDDKEGCLAVAMNNLCVRNNIDIKSFINSIREKRIEIEKKIEQRKKEM